MLRKPLGKALRFVTPTHAKSVTAGNTANSIRERCECYHGNADARKPSATPCRLRARATTRSLEGGDPVAFVMSPNNRPARITPRILKVLQPSLVAGKVPNLFVRFVSCWQSSPPPLPVEMEGVAQTPGTRGLLSDCLPWLILAIFAAAIARCAWSKSRRIAVGRQAQPIALGVKKFLTQKFGSIELRSAETQIVFGLVHLIKRTLAA